MRTQLGEEGTEQFSITTYVDGNVVKKQALHDPFIFSKTEVGFSRWELFKGMFRRRFKVEVQMSVHASPGAQRAIMTLDPRELEAETSRILAERKECRERYAEAAGNCYSVPARKP